MVESVSRKRRKTIMKGFRVCLAMGIAVLLWSSIANAGGLGFGGRYSWVRNTDTHKGTSMVGVLARLRGGAVGAEAAIDYRKDDQGGGASIKTWPVTATLLIYPLPSIYGLAGLGWYNATMEYDGIGGKVKETNTQTGYHLGAGIELPVTEGMKLAGEFRYIFLKYKFEDIPGEVGKRKADSFSLSAAAIFYLQ
jgi:opacity protein-like surface antigen